MSEKIVHIVGNRPQFIKLAPLSHELHKRGYEDMIIHSGQHYDSRMSDIFFEELEIEKPVMNLNVGSGTHAEITAKTMMGVEKAILEIKPAIVILYGDTDTTLAAALACRKLNVPVVHVEAGARTYSKENPEEMNRIVVDHVSDLCFCSDRQSVENLKKEGIIENVFFTGDIMYDTFLQMKGKCNQDLLSEYGLEKDNYVLMTWHRQENTDSKERMEMILGFLERIDCNILYPVHPRTEKMLKTFNLWDRAIKIENLILTEPLGYQEMVYLQNSCKIILTDSGGLSKESVFAGAKCLFILDLQVWPDLEKTGWLYHVDFLDESSMEQALEMIKAPKSEKVQVDFYGDGHAAEKMVDIMEEKGYLNGKINF